MTTTFRESAIAKLTEAVEASRNGLPTLAEALKAISATSSSPKLDADVALLESSVLTTLRQLPSIIEIAASTSEWETVPDDTLLRDVPGIRALDGKPSRENLERLILRALEPEAGFVEAIVALFKGGLTLLFIPSLKVFAAELVDGWPIGEVRRHRA